MQLIIYNYLNQIPNMVANRNKPKPPTQIEPPSAEERLTQLKESFFESTYAHLRLNEQTSPYPYYACLVLEHLSLLWFVLHPNLNIFGTVYLLPQLQMVLQTMNFYEYLTANSDLYVTMVLAVFFYMLLQIALILLSVKTIHHNHPGTAYQYLHKLVNFQLILNVKVLSGPILGLIVNVLYCNTNSPYHTNQICYSPSHIIMCILSVLLLLIVLAQVALFALVYYIRNPLTTCYLGQPTRLFILSKSLIKMVLPVYFALDYQKSLSLVYIFILAILWGGYLFFHRLLSIHTYAQQHFYVEFYMESVLAWFALNNVISYYIQGPNDPIPTSFIYAGLSAVLGALLLVNMERNFENRFIEECLDERVKKQNMERFIYILIHKFLHPPDADAQLNFRVYSKLIRKHLTPQEVPEPRQWREKEEIYHFLSQLVEDYIRENGSIALKILKCHLLCLLEQKSYGLHQSLELLEESRIGLIDEFTLFQFRKNHNLFGDELNGTTGSDFVRYYRFHVRLGDLEQLQQQCALNNLEYWQQLAESGPSLVKIHNLASHYNLFIARINQQYSRVTEVYPLNLYATTLQLNFLMNVAVDVRQTLKLKQKLKNILDNQNSLRSDEMGEYEGVSVITVDPIGRNIGLILNCNNHFNELLGFDRQAIIGKQVTKLMPKIYKQVHNEFMLNFMRRESSHLRPSTLKITPLNHLSLLVEMSHTVRIMASTEEALVVVSFMRRIPSQVRKGLVMIDGNTGEIFGVDQFFLSLINRRLTGKQILAEELRINSLMPEVNLETLERDGSQKTILEMGSHSDQNRNNSETNKRVLLQLRESKLYGGKKIFFLTVSKDQNSNPRSQSKKPTKDIPQMPRHSVLYRPIEIDNAINTSQQDSSSHNLSIEQIARGTSGLRNELPTVRRYEQYIKSKEESSNSLVINMIYLVYVLGCTVLVLLIYFSHNAYLASMDNLYGQMRNVSDINYYEAQINLYSEKVWDIDKVDYRIDYASYLLHLQTFIHKFQGTLYALITDTQNYPYDLQYNTRTLHNFFFSISNNGSTLTNQIALVTLDGISNYISAASALLEPMPAIPTFQSQLNLHKEALYVRQNGQTTLPTISQNAMTGYSTFIGGTTSSELVRMVQLNGLLLGLCALCLLLIVLLGNYINKTNKQVTDVYQEVRLWDVEQLVGKCNKFLQVKGMRPTRKRRSNTSLIKMLPIHGLVDLTKFKSNNGIADNKIEYSTKRLQPSLHSENYYSQNQTPAQLLSPAEPSLLDREDTCLQENKQEDYPTVHLECQFSNKPIIVAISLILLLVVAMLSGECLMVSQGQNQLITQVSRLLSIGQTRKTINFMNYFTARVIHNPNDTLARSLLVDQINLFYGYTEESYQYLGDPHNVLKQVYSIVQTLQQGYVLPNISSTGLLASNQTLINRTLQAGSDGIASLDTSIFHPQYQSSLQSCIQVLLIFTLSFIGLVLVVVVALHVLYVRPIQSQCRHSLNMLKLLPAWVLDRSKKGAAMLSP